MSDREMRFDSRSISNDLSIPFDIALIYLRPYTKVDTLRPNDPPVPLQLSG